MAMMECPKCGFSQPKDQYCANCGLNLHHFQPKPKPIGQKIGSNAYLVGGLGLMVVAGCIYILMGVFGNNRSTDLDNTLTRDADFSASLENQRKWDEESQALKRKLKETQSASSQQQQFAEASIQAQSAKPVSPGLLEKKGAAEPAKTEKIKTPERLSIQFYEIATSDFLEFEGKSLPLSRGSGFSFSKKEDAKKYISGFQFLSGGQTFALGSPHTMNFSGASDTGEPIWEMHLEVSVTVGEKEISAQLRGEIFLVKNGESIPINENLPVPLNGSVIAYGLIPKIETLAAEGSKVEGTPLAIQTSQDFKESITEWGLVLATE